MCLLKIEEEMLIQSVIYVHVSGILDRINLYSSETDMEWYKQVKKVLYVHEGVLDRQLYQVIVLCPDISLSEQMNAAHKIRNQRKHVYIYYIHWSVWLYIKLPRVIRSHIKSLENKYNINVYPQDTDI